MREETFRMRKLWLGELLKSSADGIVHNDHHDEAGATFQAQYPP
jgi:hypothetical protein